jgi:hypothetical protein
MNLVAVQAARPDLFRVEASLDAAWPGWASASPPWPPAEPRRRTPTC